ncbi:hypothetical protein PENTCL1PPCAC_12423, partial [Pristionchus entomophagus]
MVLFICIIVLILIRNFLAGTIIYWTRDSPFEIKELFVYHRGTKVSATPPPLPLYLLAYPSVIEESLFFVVLRENEKLATVYKVELEQMSHGTVELQVNEHRKIPYGLIGTVLSVFHPCHLIIHPQHLEFYSFDG